MRTSSKLLLGFLIGFGVPAFGAYTNLKSGHIFVGNSSNIATDVALSGDATMANTGALTLATVNSNVGTFNFATLTADGKGRMTAVSSGTVGALDSQAANATGLAISGSAISTQSADATHPGVVNTSSQTLPGNKTFAGNTTFTGSQSNGVRTVSANFTFDSTGTADTIVCANTTSNTISGKLPVPTSGRVLFVVDCLATWHNHTFTLNQNSADLINGGASIAFSANGGAVMIVSDGTNWFTPGYNNFAVLNSLSSYNGVTGTLGVANGGTGVTTSTGTGSVVLSASPTLTGTVIAASMTFTSGIIGSNGTSDAPAGDVGEYIESVVTPFASVGASGQWSDVTSISLTAGDWDITVSGCLTYNGATVTTWDVATSTNAGNTGTGITEGINNGEGVGPTSATDVCLGVWAYRQKVTSTTTYYFKGHYTYSVATPKIQGKISARRVR